MKVCKLCKTLSFLMTMFILSAVACLTVSAGTYIVTQYMGGSFTAPIVTVTNSAGGSITANAFKLTSGVTNVSRVSGYLMLNSVDSGSSLDMTVFYSMDGTHFYEGTTVNLPLNTKVGFTINFGSSIRTIASLFVIPTTRTWPGYGYSIWTPCFTRTLTDNTSPSISLTEQENYSNTSVMVRASITDSESGVSVRKWAPGIQNTSYFTSRGISFYSWFHVTSNGYYTVYARDTAGNATVRYIYITKMDTSPPNITVVASTEWATSNTVTTRIYDSQSGVSIRKWAYGIRSPDYFYANGTVLNGNSFTAYTNGTYTIYAKDAAENATVKTVTVNHVDNTVSVTHPITVDYSINPNLAKPFTSPDITLTNNSHLKVSVSIQELKAVSGGNITLADVRPSAFANWSSLNALNSKRYIALGVQVKEASTSANSWCSIDAVSPLYAVDITSKTKLGTLHPNGAVGKLYLTAKHGLAWDGFYNAKHKMTLIFDIQS